MKPNKLKQYQRKQPKIQHHSYQQQLSEAQTKRKKSNMYENHTFNSAKFKNQQILLKPIQESNDTITLKIRRNNCHTKKLRRSKSLETKQNQIVRSNQRKSTSVKGEDKETQKTFDNRTKSENELTKVNINKRKRIVDSRINESLSSSHQNKQIINQLRISRFIKQNRQQLLIKHKHINQTKTNQIITSGTDIEHNQSTSQIKSFVNQNITKPKTLPRKTYNHLTCQQRWNQLYKYNKKCREQKDQQNSKNIPSYQSKSIIKQNSFIQYFNQNYCQMRRRYRGYQLQQILNIMAGQFKRIKYCELIINDTNKYMKDIHQYQNQQGQFIISFDRKVDTKQEYKQKQHHNNKQFVKISSNKQQLIENTRKMRRNANKQYYEQNRQLRMVYEK